MTAPIDRSDRFASRSSLATMNPPSALAAEGAHDSNASDMLASMWRYRWAVIIPAILGTIVGFLVFLKTPETFRSSTRLMFESDDPGVFDSMTGDRMGGVPSIDILRSILFSDQVLAAAMDSEKLAMIRERYAASPNPDQWKSEVIEALKFDTETKDFSANSSMVAALTVEHQDAELCEQSVKAFSDSLQSYMADKDKSSRSELMGLVSFAIDQLHPKMTELEKRYSEFCVDAPLVWDENRVAMNPHREQQLFLTARRSELTELMRRKAIEAVAIESITKDAKDPLVALAIIGQLLEKKFDIGEYQGMMTDMKESDLTLRQLSVDEQLVPLLTERNRHASEFGESHPTVKQLDLQIDAMKAELRRLVTDQTERLIELLNERKSQLGDPLERATEAVKAVVTASNAEVKLLESQIAEVDKQIAAERGAAVKLAKYEVENAAILREIQRTDELIDQLEEQMAKISVVEDDGGLQVVELSQPTTASRVGPSFPKMVGMGLVIGALLGAGLALLLEKNANTFRDSDEVSDTLGAPVLTHVPFFKGRVRKGRKGNPNPFENLDPHLAVVHEPASVAAEAIRSCRTSVLFETAGIPGGKVIQVTSPLPGDGKSTIAGNLACSLAQSGKRTLLIDCDLRRPQITDNFNAAEGLGLIDVLNGECDYLDASHPTPLSTLRVMPSGPIPANPAEALTLTEMSELLMMLREKFDFIIIDTPPLLVVTDPSILASEVDGVVVALKIRRKSRPNAVEAVSILRNVGARVMGVVINNSDESGKSDGYRGYGYYRYGRYTNRYYRKSGGPAKTTEQRVPVIVSGRNRGVTGANLASVNGSVANGMSGHGLATKENKGSVTNDPNADDLTDLS